MCKRSSFRSYIKYIYYVNATVVFLQGGGAASACQNKSITASRRVVPPVKHTLLRVSSGPRAVVLTGSWMKTDDMNGECFSALVSGEILHMENYCEC